MICNTTSAATRRSALGATLILCAPSLRGYRSRVGSSRFDELGNLEARSHDWAELGLGLFMPSIPGNSALRDALLGI